MKLLKFKSQFTFIAITIILTFGNFAIKSLFGQDDRLAFQKISVEDGLSSSNTLCLHVDHFNRIWVGTMDGLNLYDGQKVKIFQPSEVNPNSLLGHHVKDIIQKENTLWVLTTSGISSLDLHNFKFTQYPIVGVSALTSFNDKIILSTNNGLKEIDEKAGIIRDNNLLPIEYQNISAFHENKEGLFTSTFKQWVVIYEKASGKIRKKHLPQIGNVNSIYEKDRTIWIASYSEGLFELDEDLNIVRHFHEKAEGPLKLVNNSVRSVKIDSSGMVWIGTFLGLHNYNPLENRNDLYIPKTDNVKALSHQSVWDIVEDHQNSIWVATYYGGVNFTNKSQNLYRTFEGKRIASEQNGKYVLGEILEDEEQNLWIATEGNGLEFYDKKEDRLKNYGWFNDPDFNGKNIKSLWLDKSKTLYIGTHEGGLFKLNTQTLALDKIPNKAFSRLSINDIKPIQQNLLLATSRGVKLFLPSTGEFIDFFEGWVSENKIPPGCNTILVTKDKKVWIGTKNDGIFVADLSEKKIKHYFKHNSNIHSNDIFKIYEDSQNRIWIGTYGGGLSVYDVSKDSFKSFTQASHNLPSNIIHGIQETNFDNFWIGTSKGLLRFDFGKELFYKFDKSTGFPLSEINQSSLFLTSQAQVFVGGNEGLVSFDEKSSLKRIPIEKPFFSEILVNNKALFPEPGGILEKDISIVDKINLKPIHTSLAISFTSGNHLRSFKNKYAYKLKGFDEEWVESNNQNTAYYTNLSPGTYSFMVRSIDPQYQDNYLETSLKLIVEPPFYKTNLAYFLYAVVIIVLMAMINYIYLYRTRLLDQLELEKKSKEQMVKANNQKLEFFTDVSHEFITPLSIITGTLEGLMDKKRLPDSVFNRIQIAHKSSDRLKKLAKELLDFRKMENGHFNIKAYDNNFSEFLQTIFKSYEKIAEDKHISYTLKIPGKSIYLTFDPEQLEKVLFNLLSNSFKHIPERDGEISLELKEFQTHIELKIMDNGQGIPEQDANKIFDRFYQIENIHKKDKIYGTGIGLALSKGIIDAHHGKIWVESTRGMGSTFHIKLHKGKSHFESKQLVDDHPGLYVKKALPLVSNTRLHPDNGPSILKNAPTILLIDDSDDFRMHIRSFLYEYFYIIEASNGLDGFEKAIQLQPDLIISDIIMPIMTGTQMLDKLKRNVQTAHIPVILLTAKIETEMRIEGLEHGADDYMAKPVNPKVLKTKIFNILNNRKLVHDNLKEKKKLKIKQASLSKEDSQFISKAKRIVEENIPNENFNVDVMAQELGMSRTKFYATLKSTTNKTPNDFILDIKLNKAAKLILKQPNKSIADIANQSGFSTARYFSQCFKNYFGVSPSQYFQSKNKDEFNE
ncbi:DNA-binding response regulator, AraC family [Indibacter alkaliphilus LW1]|uniref:histidine kinase n=1 Tax=Indibacter alkaliphilus (strain CCUG 57479 / KCTC 22604 / LW1) TaxID=1189612 RepID=S2DFB8_INDAL|nr:hybrid sensor histidine kinase/response regulator transcription factor [Indibacter alkaliphilus]EOZ97812.1 DNA-binding response regulator, AraC family [Indibacter alkaliphilus LW1]